MAIGHISVGDAGAIDKINNAIDQANKVDDKADYARVASAAANGAHSRPGEPGDFFGISYLGTPGDITPISSGNKIAGGNSKVAQISAAGVISRRQPWRIEPGGRQYRARVVMSRATDPSDPDGDAIRIGLAWLGSGYALVTTKTLQDVSSLEEADGRQTYTFDFPSVDIPRKADYARLFVKTFGSDGVTYVEIMEIVDMTDAVEFSPDVTALQADIAALQAELDALTTPPTIVVTDDFIVDASMNGHPIVCTSATDVTATLAADTPADVYCTVRQIGAGAITFVAEAGATVDNVDDWFTTIGPGALTFLQVASNSDASSAAWYVDGATGP